MASRKAFAALAAVMALALIGSACAKKTTTGKTTTSKCTSAPTLAFSSSGGAVHAAGALKPSRTFAKGGPVIKIGFIGDLSGSNAALVVPGRKAAQLAIEQANAKGDLPVTLQLAPKDNKEANPTTAPGLAQQLINDRSVVGVIGPAFSGETSATQPLFAAAGLTHITQSATRDDLTSHGYKTFFRAVASNFDEAVALQKILRKLGCKTVAVIDDKSAYGQDLAGTAASKLPEGGLTVVDRESIAPATDYTSLVDTLLTKKPDVVLYGGYEPQASVMLKQMREKGLKSLYVGGDGLKDVKFVPDTGVVNAEGAVLVAPAADPNTATDDASKTFVTDYRAAYKIAPDIYAPEGYDVANIFIAAIRDCGKNGASGVTRACVLNFVTTLSGFKGLTKTYGWTTDDKALHEVTDKFMNVYQVKGGELVLVGEITKIAG
jgi:branched-chain amino acid transport system substrate-binding protein